MIPAGATVLDPVGTAPGLVVPPADRAGGPTVVVLPGPPRELQPMWGDGDRDGGLPRGDRRRDRVPARDPAAVRDPRVGDRQHAAGRRRGRARARRARDHDLPAARRDRGGDALRAAGAAGLRRAASRSSRERHGDTAVLARRLDDRRAGRALCWRGRDGRGRRVVHRRPAGRPADRSRRAPRRTSLGGVVAYSNAAKSSLVGVDPALIERSGRSRPRSPRRSPTALASGSARPSGSGSPASPGPTGEPPRSRSGPSASRSAVADGERLTRSTRLPGGRADVRDRSTTVAMHLLARLLRGESD